MKILDLLECSQCGGTDFKPMGIYENGLYQVQCTRCYTLHKVSPPGPYTIYSDTDEYTDILWEERDSEEE